MQAPESVFLLSTIAIFACLTFATIIHAICEKTKMSYPVALLFGGLLLAFGVQYFDLSIFKHFSFSPEIVFFVFLPTLIFESAYHLNFRQFRGVIPEVALLSTLGLCISIAIVSTGLHFITNLPWGASILFGALISATDPVAVLAIFKEFRAPQKLSTIVDGESLLNDGTSLVIFQFILKIVITTGLISLTPKILLAESGHFFFSLFEGIAAGVVLGWIFSHAIAKSGSKGVQLTLSLILAHVTFLFAEVALHVSGILATMAAGIIMGNTGRRKLDAATKEVFSEIWEFMGFIANSLIFLLLGMKLGQVDFAQYYFPMIVSAVITIFIARPLSVFPTIQLTNLFRSKENKISLPYQIVTTWGGMRGALAAAAVLLIPETFPFATQLQAMTAGVIFGTFILNAPSIPWLLKKLKLIDLTTSERIQEFEVQILIDEQARRRLKKMLQKKYITAPVFENLEKKYSSSEAKTIQNLEKFQGSINQSPRETEKFLTYHALGIEMQTYQKLFELHEISEKRFLVLAESMMRQIERLNQNELPDERTTYPKIAPGVPQHCPCSDKAWFGIPKKIFRYHQNHKIIERFQHYRGRRIASWKVICRLESLKENHPLFKNSKFLKKIIQRYSEWNKNAEKKMAKLETQFPNIVSQAKIHVSERVCLRLEKNLIKDYLSAGLISEKVFKKMNESLAQKIQANLVWLRKHFL